MTNEKDREEARNVCRTAFEEYYEPVHHIGGTVPGVASKEYRIWESAWRHSASEAVKAEHERLYQKIDEMIDDPPSWCDFESYKAGYKDAAEHLRAILTAEPEPAVWVEHIICEGSREHVLSWDTHRRHCSEPRCVINKPAEPEPCEDVCKSCKFYEGCEHTFEHKPIVSQVADKRVEELRAQVKTLRDDLDDTTGWVEAFRCQCEPETGTECSRCFISNRNRKVLAATEPKPQRTIDDVPFEAIPILKDGRIVGYRANLTPPTVEVVEDGGD